MSELARGRAAIPRAPRRVALARPADGPPAVALRAALAVALISGGCGAPGQLPGAGGPANTVVIEAAWAYNHLGEGGNAFALAAGNIDAADDAHELVVSQPLYSGRTGRVLYFADVRDTVPDVVFTNPRGPGHRTVFGVSVSVGDVNGDGVDDILVGERTRSPGDTAGVSGQVVLFLGTPGGGPPNTVPDLVLTNPRTGPRGALDNFGDHVHIVRTPPGAYPRGIPAGGAHVMILVGARDHGGGDGAVYGYTAAGELVWTVAGDSGEFLGKWIDTADLDAADGPGGGGPGAGGLDLVVGGARATNEDPHPGGGLARVWLLGAAGSLDEPERVFDLPQPERALGTGGVNHNFGYRVVAGDATGDGIVDLIVADPNHDRTVGAVYLYEGPIHPSDRPEWILRGNPDLTDVPLLGGGIDFGDANGDGIDDFVVGVQAWAVWTDDARVYLFFGGPIDDLPGTGIRPRVATAPDADLEFRSPGFGNMGEYAMIAPIRRAPGGSEDIVATILHSGHPETRGVYLFDPHAPEPIPRADDSPVPDRPTRLERSDALDESLDRQLRRGFALGAVVAVVDRDSVVLLQSYVNPRIADLVAVDTAALFPTRAAMPLATALAFARAHADGTLDLDRAIGAHVPDLVDTLHAATTAQLLTHTAGLVARPALAGRRGDDLDAAVRQLTYIDRMAPPGAIHSHAPAGVPLAAWILQQRDGRAFARIVEDAVLRPLGMSRATATFPGADAITPGWVPDRTGQVLFVRAEVGPDSALGAPLHGLYATAADLTVLLRALLNDGVVDGEQRLPAGVVRDALRPRAHVVGPDSAQVALAGVIDRWRGRRQLTLVHRGDGHSSAVRLLLDDGIGVAILANGAASIGPIADVAFRHLLDLPGESRRAARERTARERAAADPADLDPADLRPVADGPIPPSDLAGRYANGGEVIELVVGEGGGVRLRSGGMALDIRWAAGRYHAVLPDGRPALSFRLVHDDAGRAYLRVGDRALRKVER